MTFRQPSARVLALLLILATALGPVLPAAQADNGQPPAALDASASLDAAATPVPPTDGLPALPAGAGPNPILTAVPTGCENVVGGILNPAVQPILDFQTITSAITITTNYLSVWDVAVGTDITHTYNSDLDIHLISPAGTDILLTANNGAGNDNVFSGTIWADQSALLNGSGLPVTDFVFTNSVPAPLLNPQEPLGALRGQNPNGVWKLVVHDGAAADQGNLLGWFLELNVLLHAPDVSSTTYSSIPGGVGIPDKGVAGANVHFAGLPDPISAITVSTVITHPLPGTLTVTLVSPGGVPLTLSSNNGDSKANVFAGTTWDDRADQLQPPGLVTTHVYTANVLASPLAPEEGLSELLGTSANGFWTLKVTDGTSDGHTGTLGPVVMAIQTAHCFPDLHAGISTAPEYPLIGQSATVHYTAHNTSVTATNISLTANLDPQLRYKGLLAPGWSCSAPPVNSAGGQVLCTRPSLGPGPASDVAVTVTLPLVPISVHLDETIALAGPDTNPADNAVAGHLVSYAYSQNQNPWDLDPGYGYVEDGGQDAFDDWGGLRVAVAQGGTLLDDVDPSNFGLVFAGPDQRWNTTVPQTVAGIQINRKLYAPVNQNWLRYLDTFHNTTGVPLTLFVAWGGNLGSDTSTYPAATSSGDMVIGPNDNWAVTQQDPPPGPAGDAPVGYALRSPANPSYMGPVIFDDSAISTTWPVTGNDELAYLYTFSLAPGASKRLAYFVFRGLEENTAGPEDCSYYGDCVTPLTGAQVSLAGSIVAGLVSQPALCDLSVVQRASLVNWTVPVANCHDVFLSILTR